MLLFLKEILTEIELDWIAKIIQSLYNWVGTYGWTIIVFTIILKLLTLPLDYWQRYTMKIQSAKMEHMQPMIEKIDKAYADDKQRAQEEKSKLYKKQGYSVLSSCLPMIINLVVFFTVFGGLNTFASYININTFNKLYDTYTTVYETVYQGFYDADFQINLDQGMTESKAKSQAEISATEKANNIAKDAVGQVYMTGSYVTQQNGDIPPINIQLDKKLQENFLWINNIWRPDTWSSTMPSFDEFKNGGVGIRALSEKDKSMITAAEYQVIYEGVTEANLGYNIFGSNWNGLLILPVLTIGLSFFSTKLTSSISSRKKKNGEVVKAAPASPQAASNKMMMYMMPVMMGVFGILYTSAFATYMVISSLFSIISMLALNPIIDRAVENKIAKQTPTVSYRRK